MRCLLVRLIRCQSFDFARVPKYSSAIRRRACVLFSMQERNCRYLELSLKTLSAIGSMDSRTRGIMHSLQYTHGRIFNLQMLWCLY